MKIDELISELEAVREEHGNLEVGTGRFGADLVFEEADKIIRP